VQGTDAGNTPLQETSRYARVKISISSLGGLTRRSRVLCLSSTAAVPITQ
jgi:hypothetical protein